MSSPPQALNGVQPMRRTLPASLHRHETIDLTQDGAPPSAQSGLPQPGAPNAQEPQAPQAPQAAVVTIDLTLSEDMDTDQPLGAEAHHSAGIHPQGGPGPPQPPTGSKRMLPDSFGQGNSKAARSNHQNSRGAPTVPAPPLLILPRPGSNQAHHVQGLVGSGQAHAAPQGSKRVLPASCLAGFATGSAVQQHSSVQPLQWDVRNGLAQANTQTAGAPLFQLPAPTSAPVLRFVAPPPELQGAKRLLPSSLTLPKALPMPIPTVVDHQAAMKAVLENLALTGDDEIDPPQKSLMISIMRHQRMALAWMVKRELGSTPQGGILADDQGLGKTISTISLIVTNMPDPTTRGRRVPKRIGMDAQPALDPGSSSSRSVTPEPSGPQVRPQGAGPAEDDGLLPGGTLVVCPTTVLHQWHRELCEKVNRAATNFTVHIYHGKDKAASAVQLSRYTVVLTTYGTLAMEAPASVRQGAKGKKAGAASASTPQEDDSVSDAEEDGRGRVFGAKQEDSSDMDTKEGVIKHESKGMVTIKHERKAEQGESDATPEPPTPRERAPGGSTGGSTAGSAASAGGSGASGAARRRSVSTGPGDGGGLLFQVGWHRIVLDEAQSIKNPRTLVAHAAWGLSADHRWCLSGTPIQNSVDDLFSYFKFLRYAPYNDASSFKSLIKDKIVNNPEAGFKLLSVVLQAILLRRTKQSKLNGEPIISIPPREQHLDAREFLTKAESAFYAKVQEESRACLEAASQAGGAQYVNMLYSLLKLRQACNHPWLVKGLKAQQPGGAGAPAQAASAQGVAAARKLGLEERTRLLELVLHPAAQCPSCQDVPEQAVVTRCGHVYCSDCVATQMEGTGTGQSDEFTCVTCSSVVQSSEMYSGAALQAAQGGKALAGGGAGTSQPKNQPVAPGEWTSSTKVDRLLQLLSEVRQRNGDTVAATGPAPVASNVLAVRSKADKALARTFKSLGPAAPRGGPGASGPLLRDGRRPEKVIVFSQWTGMLDLLEVALRRDTYVFRRLDGTMPVATRERAITDFEQKSEVNILLVSLKAAALGLNLTVANHVVLMDLWWNPTIEEQAIDRAHRIGQKRTVYVTRITIKGTVEERILELQERKRELISAALCEGGGAATASKLSMEDLRFLFMGVPPPVAGGSGTGPAKSAAAAGASGPPHGGTATAVTTQAQVHAGSTLDQVLR